MINIEIEQTIKTHCPALRLGCLMADIEVELSGPEFTEEARVGEERLKERFSIEDLSGHPVNGATRTAYKSLGKKPGRYRPSAEALMRRILQGKGLYSINNVVDVVNLLSFSSGFSICGYDVDKIQGAITLGRGKENEPYQALGRGELNIHNLPVFRDEVGAFGSPTSDSERTGITQDTQRILFIFMDFASHSSLDGWLQKAEAWLGDFASAKNVSIFILP